jgi:hypothetical protein
MKLSFDDVEVLRAIVRELRKSLFKTSKAIYTCGRCGEDLPERAWAFHLAYTQGYRSAMTSLYQCDYGIKEYDLWFLLAPDTYCKECLLMRSANFKLKILPQITSKEFLLRGLYNMSGKYG